MQSLAKPPHELSISLSSALKLVAGPRARCRAEVTSARAKSIKNFSCSAPRWRRTPDSCLAREGCAPRKRKRERGNSTSRVANSFVNEHPRQSDVCNQKETEPRSTTTRYYMVGSSARITEDLSPEGPALVQTLSRSTSSRGKAFFGPRVELLRNFDMQSGIVRHEIVHTIEIEFCFVFYFRVSSLFFVLSGDRIRISL